MAKRIVSFGMVQVVFNDFGLDVVAGKNVSKKLHFVITGHYRTLGVFVQISAEKDRRDPEQVKVLVTDHIRRPLVGNGPFKVTGVHGIRKALRRAVKVEQQNRKQPIAA